MGIAALVYFSAYGFGGGRIDFAIFGKLAATPGLATTLIQTFFVGFASTALATFIALLLPAVAGLGRLADRLSPILVAIPHLSMAVALAFLLSPSGWLIRSLSPWATGLERPPIGLGGEFEAAFLLIFGLVVKEVPFLLLVAMSQLPEIDPKRWTIVGRTLGYGATEAWIKLVLPQLYRRMRAPIVAVLLFSMANVEMALPLGPSNPPMLPVMALDMLNDPEPFQARLGGALSLLLVVICILAIAIWFAGHRLFGSVVLRWMTKGAHSLAAKAMALAMTMGAGTIALAALASVAALFLWSIAGRWRFPQALPQSYDFGRFWDRLSDLWAPAWNTIWLAALTVALALIVATLWLEYRRRAKIPAWLYLPLLVPQIALLAGLNFMLLSLGFGVNVWGVVAGHFLFVLPYVVMVLGDGFYALDPRYARSARSLGHSRIMVLLRIKLPMLRATILTAAAIGFSVSVAQYLPTIFAGGGRFDTLATEIIAISHGGDRRMMAVCGLLLAVLPLLVLTLSQVLGRANRIAPQ